MRATTFMAMVACSVLAAGAKAQVASDDSVKRARCLASVDSFRSATTKQQREGPLQTMQYCPDELRIAAFRSLIRDYRQLDKDEAMWIVYRLVFYRDAGLGRDVLELAGDRLASPQSRIVAFMAMYSIKHPGRSPRYEGFSGGLDARGIPKELCATLASHTYTPPEGSPTLPPGFMDEARSLAVRVYEDRTEPEEVRSAAACF